MLTLEETEEALDNAAHTLPDEFYHELNGGIILRPDYKKHPADSNGNLYILGEYHHDPMGLGRYILIYYGSFTRVYGGLPHDEIRLRLDEVLRHEFTHHIESLAGERTLILKDELNLAEYLSSNAYGSP